YAIVIDKTLGLETSVRPLGASLAQLLLGDVEQAVEAGEDFLLAILGRKLVETALTQPVGAELAADVAEHELGRAAVGADDALDVGDGAASPLIAHRRQVQAFVEHLARLSRATPRHRPADV